MVLLRRPLRYCLLFVAPGLALALATPLASADVPFTSSVRINDDTGTADQEAPSVAVDTRGNAYVLWTDYRWDRWHPGIYFSRRDAITRAWSANEKVNDSDVRRRGTGTIAVDGAGNAYSLFWDQRNEPPEYPFLGRAYDVYFSRRDAATGAWSANERVSDAHATVNAGWPNIAVDGAGNAYALWSDNRNLQTSSTEDIWFAKRDASTGTWSANERVNDQAEGWQNYPQGLGIDGFGSLYAVWMDSRNAAPPGLAEADIYFSRWDASTGAWSANERVSDDSTAAQQQLPVLAVDRAGNAYAIWTDWRNASVSGTDVYFSMRDAATGTWSANEKVNDDSGSASYSAPGVAVDAAGNVHAIWLDNRRGDWDLYYSRRDAATGAWSANVRVNDVDVFTGSEDTWGIGVASIAVDPAGSAVYVVWGDNRAGNHDIYFASTSPEGKKAYVPFVARAYPSGW